MVRRDAGRGERGPRDALIIVGFQLLGVAIFAASAPRPPGRRTPRARERRRFEQIEDTRPARCGPSRSSLAWGVFAIVLGAKFNSGGNGVRITLVFGVITAILGIYPFVLVGLVHTVLAILVAVFVGNRRQRLVRPSRATEAT